MIGQVEKLQTFPVKGLSAVAHDRVDIAPGEGFPGDRVFGFAKGNSGFDASNPKPLPKDRFLVLLEHEALAGLKTRMNPATLQFEITTQDGKNLVFDLGESDGQTRVCQFFKNLLSLSDEEAPFFAQAYPHRFTDVSVASHQMMNAISLLNRASIEELAEKAGTYIDPARFRGNILVDGWPPFAELDLVGKQLQLGDITFEVLKRTRRCPATRVNPETAERDLDVPGLIRRYYGHMDMGVYIEARESGRLEMGAPAKIL